MQRLSVAPAFTCPVYPELAEGSAAEGGGHSSLEDEYRKGVGAEQRRRPVAQACSLCAPVAHPYSLCVPRSTPLQPAARSGLCLLGFDFGTREQFVGAQQAAPPARMVSV